MSERRARPVSKDARKSVWRRAPTPPQPPAPNSAPAPSYPAPPSSPEGASVVQAALYRDGVRVSAPATLA